MKVIFALLLSFIMCASAWPEQILCNAEEEIRWDDLVSAIIICESDGNPNAVSPQGCIGLMQINPKGALAEYEQCTGALHTTDLFNPIENIHLGTWYLKRLKDHYLKEDYTIERMLASYNGGPTRMRRLLREGKDWQDMPKESVNYVKKVTALYYGRVK